MNRIGGEMNIFLVIEFEAVKTCCYAQQINILLLPNI